MPESPKAVAPTTGAPTALEPEIHVIPDAFYGSALKTKIEDKPAAPNAPAAPRRSRLPLFITIGVLVLAVGGGFVYFNRDLLFPAATPQVVVKPPEVIPAPTAPSGATATSTNFQSATLTWTDTSANENGFRIERHEGDGVFRSLTNLPSNSSSFLDVSVQAGKTYTYRVIASNTTGDSSASNEATASVPLPPVVPEAPKLPPAGLDTDSDGITDLEEVLYVTEARNPDTDGDGFLDGNEVFHLYNPAGQAPVRLLDSNLVKVMTAPVGWVLSIPASWTMTLNTPDGTRATIDTKHGERFVVTVEPNPEKKPIVDWYLETHPTANASQVLQYRSKTGYAGIIGTDLLTTYIPWEDRVFVVTYDLDDQPFINYRTTYSMILNSLVLSGVPQVAPEPGTPLPFEPSATTSGVVTQPEPVNATSSATSTAP